MSMETIVHTDELRAADVVSRIGEDRRLIVVGISDRIGLMRFADLADAVSGQCVGTHALPVSELLRKHSMPVYWHVLSNDSKQTAVAAIAGKTVVLPPRARSWWVSTVSEKPHLEAGWLHDVSVTAGDRLQRPDWETIKRGISGAASKASARRGPTEFGHAA